MRTVIRENYRVVIEPDTGWGSRNRTRAALAAEQASAASELESQARRHIDARQVYVDHDLVTVCSRGEWNDEGVGDLRGRWPTCCAEDQAEFYLEHRDESDAWFTVRGMDDPDYLAEFRAGMHLPNDSETP